MRRPALPPPCSVPQRLALSVLAGVLGACAPLPPADGPLRPWQVAELDRQAERLERSPRTIRDPALVAWIVERLRLIDPEHGPTLRVFVLDDPATQADLVGGKLLRVRAGLLRELRDEPELLFVLAHEVAHRRLGHVAARESPNWDAIGAEIEADRVARQSLRSMGLAPDTGQALLQRLAAGLKRTEDLATIRRRIDALASPQPATPSDVDEPYRTDPARFAQLMSRYR
jgi:hypothetical protein